MNWKAKAHITLGIIIWLIPITAYLTSIYFSITLFLLPLIELYGFWNWLGMFLAIFFSAALSSGLFFFMVGHVRTPRDIYEGHTS